MSADNRGATEEDCAKILVGDGFCPICGALDDEACITPTGAVRQNHKRRHVSVGTNRFSEHWTRLSEADRP